MASVDIFGGSYLSAAWQDVIDPSATVFEVPYGALHPLFNGFGYQNTDSTYTLFMGEEAITLDEDGDASGVVTDIIRVESLTGGLDPDNVLAHVWEPFTASGVQNAFLDGGYTLMQALFTYDDVVTIDSPSFGGLTWIAPPVATGTGADVVYGSLHHDSIDTGAQDDTVYGDEGDDTVNGGTGDDLIYGEDGRDVLYGEDGWDVMHGGRGADSLFGGDGQDSLYGNRGDDFIAGGRGIDRIEGNGGDDEIEGNGGDDRLFGGAGADVIRGGAGHDDIHGSDGDDSLYGDDGRDFINGGRHSDAIFGGDGKDTLVGERGDDALYGGDQDDYLVGDVGDDLMNGGNGNDFLDGGEGLDSVLYLLPRIYYTVTVHESTLHETFVTVSSVGSEGYDQLVDVERLLFPDQIMWV
jgi:Ca2+-binding RTX toxin-like protein